MFAGMEFEDLLSWDKLKHLMLWECKCDKVDI